MIDKDGDEYLKICDGRDAQGNITNKFYADGNTTEFTVMQLPSSTIQVTVDDVVVTNYTLNNKTYTFTTAPASGAVVLITYKSNVEGYAAKYFSFGLDNEVQGTCSFAEGRYTKALGDSSHAEGTFSEATGNQAHAEGYYTHANALASHAEGYYSKANKVGAHAEGYNNTASGEYSHAEGSDCEASAFASHASGNYTIAAKSLQTVIGSANIEDTGQPPTSSGGRLDRGKYVFIVGNGYKRDGNAGFVRSNALTVDWDGNVEAAGGITVNGHSTPIGTVYSNSASVAISTANINTYAQGPSVTLPAGVYIIKGLWQFNTGSGTRTTDVDLTTVSGTTADSSPLARVRIAQANGNWVAVEATALKEFTSQTTVYVKGSSTVTNTAQTCYIHAIRIA